ncbi:MAG: two component system sensor histidine kinase barA-like, partial [Erysipelotrichaceae bacterium]
EKDKRAAELIIANKELAYQNEEKKRRVKITGELKEQNVGLEIEKKLLAEASQQKSSFLSNMSHEIRTPLNAIIGFTELVLKTELTIKQYNYLSKIKTSSRSLLGLISDILDLSKIEAGKLELDITEFNLNEVVQNVINQVSIKSHEKGLDLKVLIDENVPTNLKGDSLRLGQILLNLVNNAVKFTDKGVVFIHIQLLKYHGNFALIHFSIKDTGIGISQKQIEILFQPFSQANTSTTSRYGGTGLGLSIASNLTSLMDGEIGVESELGVGSTFYFTAKIEISEKRNNVNLRDLIQKWAKKVLVVDDDTDDQIVIGNMLEDVSLKATMCSSGEEAIALLQKTKDNCEYGLILMDWKMPKLDGFETSRKIKMIFPATECPTIVIITAYNSAEVQEKANDLGLEAILLKPISASLMMDTIMRIIDKDDINKYDFGVKRESELSYTPQLNGIRVLLVEDNEVNQEVAKEILSQAGLIVSIANNGQEAVAKVKENIFDIVLMDIQMPIMDGYDATREIRKSPALATLPIISMTANALLRDQQKCLEAGMNDNVSKPIDTKQLFQKIEHWVLKEIALPHEKINSAPIIGTDPSQTTLISGSANFQFLASFDFKQSLDRLGGNLEFYYQLLEKFRNNHKDEIGRIQSALVVNDFKAARILAHTLKSAAGNVGALHVSEKAALLENVLGEENLSNVESLLKQLNTELNDAVTSIALFLKSTKSAETFTNSQIDMNILSPLFSQLEKSLSDFDMASKHDLEEILILVKNSKISDEVADIKRFVEQYNYEDALKLLKNLVNSL